MKTVSVIGPFSRCLEQLQLNLISFHLLRKIMRSKALEELLNGPLRCGCFVSILTLDVYQLFSGHL